MFKRILIILLSVFLLTGCMPSPIKKSAVSKTEQNMVIRSLSSLGNTFRINKKLKSAKKGEPLVIAYVGSSVFSDDEQGNSVARISFELIKKIVGKKANLKFVNLSIEGSDSILGNIMLNKEVLSQKPDIVILDYALFDNPEQDYRESFESIIRNSLTSSSEPQILIFLNSNSDGTPKQDYMEQVGKYYNIPIINVATAIQPEIASGRTTVDKFYVDKRHLTPYGEQTLAKFIENYIVQSAKTHDKNYNIPTPMNKNSMVQNIKYVDSSKLQADNDGSYFRAKTKNKYFPNKIEYMTNTGNSPFIFTVDANLIYLIAPTNANRDDIAEIYINGKKMTDIITQGKEDTDIPHAFKIYSNTNTQKIAVGIKIKDKNKQDDIDLTKDPTETDTQSVSTEIKDNNTIQKSDFEFWGIGYCNNNTPENQN